MGEWSEGSGGCGGDKGWVMGRLARCSVQLGGGGGGRTGVTYCVLSLTLRTAHPLWTD